MNKTTQDVDRYISFEGIKCNQNADRLMGMLEHNLTQQIGDTKWQTYFADKLAHQQRCGHDNLHFIGNQMNILFDYFTQCDDQPALALLYQIEQECC
ncbi:N(2)-fixation sustaining protein CowN [Vibrio tritonius]|uniref:N(2)-fixation sustaining protein CowN n=1 Tax=Vibrio tritonius TaxID=1435069 RepID=UPI000838D264|nr:N(2)-fixation sustaining protein CowN [Vibrio tritonius]